jgi:hypothetical protein
MYVRWQSRKRRKPQFGHYGKTIRDARRGGDRFIARAGTNERDQHWRAILVENVRIDGKPTQRHVAYLGGITESGIEIVAQRCFFWDKVRERLDALRLTDADRRQIEATVAERVPRPTRKQQRAVERNLRALGID